MKYKNIILQVRVSVSGANCWSSKDTLGYKHFNGVKEMELFLKENYWLNYNKKGNIIKDRDLSLYYIIADTLTHNSHKEDVEKIFDCSKKPKIITQYYEKLDNKRYAQRKSDGYVWCKDYKEMTSEDYYGRLYKLKNNKYLQEYIESGCVWGYLGHENRKLIYDEAIEELIKEKPNDIKGKIANWMCSSFARHWMDNINYLSKEEFEKVFNKEILSEIE